VTSQRLPIRKAPCGRVAGSGLNHGPVIYGTMLTLGIYEIGASDRANGSLHVKGNTVSGSPLVLMTRGVFLL
jgi:hypothetical protein